MTEPTDLLRPDAVRIGLSASTKKALFHQLGAIASSSGAFDGEQVAEGLATREKLGSTGFGAGVAIPHAKLPGLRQVTGLLVRLAQPMDYKAVDALPVDLVFALLSPTDAGAEHLKALAGVSRRLRDPAFLTKLRGAVSPDALWALWSGDDGHHVA